MKFGGSSVATPQHFTRIARIIRERKKESGRLVIVISAMGDTTNQLLQLAHQVHPSPPTRELDMLISVGERISISLLAMALAHIGCEAVSFTGSQSGIVTDTRHSEARIIDVRPQRLLTALDENKIAIVAGFQGVSQKKDITTLGRGGSDTSAVALAIALGAKQVEFYKDVPGFFTDDPHQNPSAQHIPSLGYDEALTIIKRGCRILSERAVRLAKEQHLPLKILSFLEESEGRTSFIGDKNRQPTVEMRYELSVPT